MTWVEGARGMGIPVGKGGTVESCTGPTVFRGVEEAT